MFSCFGYRSHKFLRLCVFYQFDLMFCSIKIQNVDNISAMFLLSVLFHILDLCVHASCLYLCICFLCVCVLYHKSVCVCVYTYVPAGSGFRSFVLQHSACLPPQEIQGSLSSGHTKALAFFEVLKTSIYAFPGQKAPKPIFESIGNTGRHCGHASSALISQILKLVCGEQDFSN